MGHWIEEPMVGEWEEKEALFGFTQMNTAHNGARLGEALFMVCHRLGIVSKVSKKTCLIIFTDPVLDWSYYV